MRRVLAAVSLVLLLVAVPTVGAVANGGQTVRDEFNAVSYSGSDGTLPWAHDWLEWEEFDGPDAGDARVVSDPRCASGYCLRIGGDSGNVKIFRMADVSDATSLTLSFRYRRAKGNGKIRLSISKTGGLSWTQLKEYRLNKDDGSEQYESVDVGEYISPWTVIRFEAIGTDAAAAMFIDDVEFLLEGGEPATTTTSTSTTTTVPPTTTTVPPTTTTSTTTVPPTTTTTTTVPSTTTTSTTTVPPTTTTTTTVPSATTTTSTTTFSGAAPTRPHGPVPPQLATKESLVVVGSPASAVQQPAARFEDRTPVEGLWLGFVISAEEIRQQMVWMMLLGALVSVLLIAGTAGDPGGRILPFVLQRRKDADGPRP